MIQDHGYENLSAEIPPVTNEKMGFVGRKEGVCAHAVALVHKA